MRDELLDALGLPATYLGYRYLAFSVSLVRKDEELLLQVSKRLYPAVADHFRVSPTSVERCIRTAVSRFWNHGNRALLDQLAGYHLVGKPTGSEIIALLAKGRPTATAAVSGL